MTDPITVKLWQIIATALASGAVSGTGAVITMQIDQAVNDQRITQNSRDIVELESRFDQQIDRLQDVTLQLTQIATRLEK